MCLTLSQLQSISGCRHPDVAFHLKYYTAIDSDVEILSQQQRDAVSSYQALPRLQRGIIKSVGRSIKVLVMEATLRHLLAFLPTLQASGTADVAYAEVLKSVLLKALRYASDMAVVVAFPLLLVEPVAMEPIFIRELLLSTIGFFRQMDPNDSSLFWATLGAAFYDQLPSDILVVIRVTAGACIVCISGVDLTAPVMSGAFEKFNLFLGTLIHRVNQRGLLHSLNSTRIASQYLIRANRDEVDDEDVEPRPTFVRNATLPFVEEEFSCPRVYAQTVALHVRLPAARGTKYYCFLFSSGLSYCHSTDFLIFCFR
jgi:hypothetical protein